MFRTDAADSVISLPAPPAAGTPGYFSDGNPGVGTPGTVVDAAWANMIQEELIAVVVAAGETPSKTTYTQIRDAITALITNAAVAFASLTETNAGAITNKAVNPAGLATILSNIAAKAAAARTISPGGLLTGGGDLSADRTITLAKASAAEILAGTEDGKAITPLGFVTAMALSLSSNGYFKLPGGVIFQWGTGTAAANANTTITLPTTFPTACAFAGCNGSSAGANDQDNPPTINIWGTSTINAFSARDEAVAIRWLAIGY